MGTDLRKKPGPKPMPIDVRFWRRVPKGNLDACWEWDGSRLAAGYGQFGLTRSRPVLAHRMAWELTHGPIPEGMHVLHRCDNPPCCNPTHLFLGSNSDNIADRVAKGRSPVGREHWSSRNGDRVARGERAGGAKLTQGKVDAIRQLRAQGVTQRELAERFGVSRATIYLIQEGKRWNSSTNPS